MRHYVVLWIGVFLIALVVACGVNRWGQPSRERMAVTTSPVAAVESVLHRVQRTKTLRCAYWIWPELIERDPNTGAMKGAFVDVIDKVAEGIGAKVEWVSEANIDDFIQLANSDKVDAVCGPLIGAPFLRPQAAFAAPILYASFDVYVRADDARFDASRGSIDSPGVALLSLDGSAGRYFATTVFTHAHQNSLPAMVGAGQILLDVVNKKADATVSEQLTGERFLDHNPGTLKRVRWTNQPLITLGLTPFVTKVDDAVWSNTLDAILRDLLDFGVVEQVLTQHGLIAGRHYQPIAPFYRKSP